MCNRSWNSSCRVSTVNERDRQIERKRNLSCRWCTGIIIILNASGLSSCLMDINNIQSIGQFAAFVTLLTWMSREDRSIDPPRALISRSRRLHMSHWLQQAALLIRYRYSGCVISYVICTIVDDHPGCEGKSIGIVYLLHIQIFYILFSVQKHKQTDIWYQPSIHLTEHNSRWTWRRRRNGWS